MVGRKDITEKVSKCLITCSCDVINEKQKHTESISHFVNVEKSSGKKFHSVAINQFDDGKCFVDSCSYNPKRNIRSILERDNFIPIDNITQQGAAILMTGFCCPPACLKNKVEDKYIKNDGNKDYFQKNSVVCPICGLTPDRYEDFTFYHNSHGSRMYSCWIRPIFRAFITTEYGFPINKAEYVSSWSKSSNGRWWKDKHSDGSDVLEREMSALKQKLKEKEKEIKRLRNYENVASKQKECIKEKAEKVEKLKKKNKKLTESIEQAQKLIEEGTPVTNKNKKSNTKSFQSPKDKELVHRMERLVTKTPGKSYVYVIEVMYNGAKHYYVGKSNNPVSRLQTHLREKKVIGIDSIEGCKTEDDALQREREKSYELAIEEDTTKILGGH